MSISIPPLSLRELSSPSSRTPDESLRRATADDGSPAAGREAQESMSVASDGDRLRSFLDRRGMEIGFVIDARTGSSRMVVVDATTGSTVLEIPAGSSLESAAKEVLASR